MKEINLDNSVRLKVTNECQLSCSFCHNEGTESPSNSKYRTSLYSNQVQKLPPVQDLPYEENLLKEICELKEYGINEIHLTGGEPTRNKDIFSIVSYFNKNQFIIKMTSNGQFDRNLIENITAKGLKSINFSILSLDPNEFLETQIYKSQDWAKDNIERLCSSIVTAKELGIPVKANTIINNKSDYKRVDSILQFCENLNIVLVLLNNVSLGKESENAVFDYIKDKGGVLILTKEPSNNSRGKKTYLLPNGHKIEAKYFRDYHPEAVCGDCGNKGTEACSEKYYGLRVEMRDKLYARLCIQESNEKTLMPLDNFLARGVYKTL